MVGREDVPRGGQLGLSVNHATGRGEQDFPQLSKNITSTKVARSFSSSNSSK